MKTSLYQIETEHLALMQQIENAEGEITEEIAEQLEINEGQLQSKSIAYLSVIKSKESFNSQIDEEIKRLQAMKKRNNTLVTNLKNRLLDAVKLFGDFESNLSSFGTRKSSSVEVENVNALPKEFKVIKVTEQADKAALKKAIKEGKEIEGVSIVEKLNLKIN
jgi:vacuolar-type H+-ATPase subunit I/STV1